MTRNNGSDEARGGVGHERPEPQADEAESSSLFAYSPVESPKKAFMRAQRELSGTGSFMHMVTGGLGQQTESAEKEKRLQDEFWERVVMPGAAWLKQTRMIGGRDMTNEQIMNARKDILADKDRYSQWAITNKVLKPQQLDAFWSYMTLKQQNDEQRAAGRAVPESEAQKEREGDKKFGEAHDKFIERKIQERSIGPARKAAEEMLNTTPMTNGTASADLERAMHNIVLRQEFDGVRTGLPAAPATKQPVIAMADAALTEKFAQAGTNEIPAHDEPLSERRAPEPEKPDAPLPDSGASNLGF